MLLEPRDTSSKWKETKEKRKDNLSKRRRGNLMSSKSQDKSNSLSEKPTSLFKLSAKEMNSLKLFKNKRSLRNKRDLWTRRDILPLENTPTILETKSLTMMKLKSNKDKITQRREDKLEIKLNKRDLSWNQLNKRNWQESKIQALTRSTRLSQPRRKSTEVKSTL